MGSSPWLGKDYVKSADRNPAVYISWEDCQGFVNKLGSGFRLPTEAEWEYACRAGSATAYSFGDGASQLKDYAWYDKNAWDIGEKYAHGVGLKKPNAWGLYDMHGNVWEWCQDWKGDYPSGSVTDPTGPSRGSSRVFRGGSFDGSAGGCRSADRGGSSPGDRCDILGARPARSLP